jgi:hypothetical protein
MMLVFGEGEVAQQQGEKREGEAGGRERLVLADSSSVQQQLG